MKCVLEWINVGDEFYFCLSLIWRFSLIVWGLIESGINLIKNWLD